METGSCKMSRKHSKQFKPSQFLILPLAALVSSLTYLAGSMFMLPNLTSTTSVKVSGVRK